MVRDTTASGNYIYFYSNNAKESEPTYRAVQALSSPFTPSPLFLATIGVAFQYGGEHKTQA